MLARSLYNHAWAATRALTRLSLQVAQSALCHTTVLTLFKLSRSSD